MASTPRKAKPVIAAKEKAPLAKARLAALLLETLLRSDDKTSPVPKAAANRIRQAAALLAEACKLMGSAATKRKAPPAKPKKRSATRG